MFKLADKEMSQLKRATGIDHPMWRWYLDSVSKIQNALNEHQKLLEEIAKHTENPEITKAGNQLIGLWARGDDVVEQIVKLTLQDRT